MKAFRLLTLSLMAASALQAAPKTEKEPAIPKEKEGRWGVYSMEDAQKEALKKKQPIAFIAIDEKAEDVSVVDAGRRLFWSLERYATLVVLNSNTAGTWAARLPAPAVTAFTSAEIGKEYPKVVVIDQKGEVVLGTMTSAQIIGGEEKAMKEFGRRMDDSNKKPPAPGATPSPAAAPATPGAPAADPAAPAGGATTMPAAPAAGGPVAITGARPDAWTNNEGRTIQATLVEIGTDKVVFLMPNGSKIDYPIASLNEDSKKKLETMKAAAAK